MNPKSQTLFGFKLEQSQMDPGGKRIREIGWLDIFFLLWEKMILFLPFVFSCSLLSVSSMDHSFLSSLHPSVCLSAPWHVCFLSLFTPVTIALSPLFFFLLPFICGLFLLIKTCGSQPRCSIYPCSSQRSAESCTTEQAWPQLAELPWLPTHDPQV